MSAEALILAALGVPLLGALLIGMTGRINANLREAATLLTALGLIACAGSR